MGGRCERKFVISKNKEEFSLIKKAGVSNITDEQLDMMACKYFKLRVLDVSCVVCQSLLS